MNFKQWLLLNEISSVVSAKEMNKDKIRLYHGTSTGVNNERIESFIKQGAAPIGIGHGQGKGFYVSNKLSKTKDHALNILGLLPDVKKPMTGIAHVGKPMVVVLEFDQIDFKQWDFDAETMNKIILTRAAKMLEKKPDKTWKGSVSPKSIEYLQQDKGNHIGDLDGNPDISLKKTVHDTLQRSVAKNHMSFVPPGSKHYDPEEMFGTTDAAALSLVYQAHQDSSKGRHEKIEAAAFKIMFDKRTLDIKYTGSQPLPISEILVFDNNEWHSIEPKDYLNNANSKKTT